MTLRQRRPLWRELATSEELSKIDELDRTMDGLRRQRQSLVNRAKLRTDVWVQRHGSLERPARRKGRAA